MSRDEFMFFFRDTELLNQLSVSDRIEIFETILLGNSDFTKELFERIFIDYSVTHLEITEIETTV